MKEQKKNDRRMLHLILPAKYSGDPSDNDIRKANGIPMSVEHVSTEWFVSKIAPTGWGSWEYTF